jgi:hypothetical protein
MSIAKQEFTDAGRSMLGRAQNGERLTITNIVVGSGSASQPSELWPLAALITPEMVVPISTKSDYGQGTLLVEGSLRSDTAPHAFDLREVGVMAHLGTEADRLYSVANCLLEAPNHIDPAAPTIEVFKIKLIIDRIPADMLTISIGPSENVIGENLGLATDGPGWYTEALGNVLKFKRIIQGAAMDIHDTTDGNGVYVGTKMLTVDLDLYVPATHPDCPDPSVGFPTVQAAVNYLLPWTIPSGRWARIHVYKGTWFHDGTNVNHPNARQIQLLGWPRQDKTITAINYLDATHKNITVSPDASGLTTVPNQPGNLVYIASTQCPSWTGGCIVTNIVGNVVTLTSPSRSSRLYSTSYTGQYARLSWYPSVMVINNTNPQIAPQNLQCYYGIDKIENFTFRNGFHGIALYQSGKVRNVMCMNNWGGIASDVSVGVFGEVVLADCQTGLTGNNAIDASGQGPLAGPGLQLYINACGQGIAPSQGAGAWIGRWNGAVSQNTVIVFNRCIYAVSSQGSQIWISNVNYEANDVGMIASMMGGIFHWPYLSYPSNNGTDLVAGGASYIEYHVSGGPGVTCNPPAGVVGNNNALIVTPATRMGLMNEEHERILQSKYTPPQFRLPRG